MKKLPLSALMLLALSSAACDNDPAKGKAQATVSEPGAAPKALAAPSTNAVNYAFSQAGSKVELVGAKVTKKHDGKVNTFSGVIQLVENDPTKSSVQADLDLRSVTMDDAKLTGHLQSPDFFDVARFPKATFKSTAIKAGGDNGATHTVSGNLELHGVTKQISFPARIKHNAELVQVEAEFAINRRDFGIVYPGMANDLIKDEVLILLKLEAKKG
jgi:polyisoprenoid-binding protein YceI